MAPESTANAVNDFPLEELATSATKVINAGGSVYQKWTCEACGERPASTKANVFCTSMEHEDCPVDPGHVTETPRGNYVVVVGAHRVVS